MTSLTALVALQRARLQRHHCFCIAVFAVLSLLAFVIFNVGNVLSGGAGRAWDHAILLALRAPNGEPGVVGGKEFMALIVELTSFGDDSILAILVAIGAAYWWLANQKLKAAMVLIAVLSGALIARVLKIIFDRHEWDYRENIFDIWPQNFPSGHAMMAAIVYLTFARLIAASQETPALARFVLAIALGLTLTVGYTRIHMGIHYPTDIFGGWAIGAAWALALILVERAISRHLAARNLL